MIKQVSVFLENRAGRLNYLLKILTDNEINIKSLSIADTGEYGIARLIVSDFDKAIKVLTDNGMTVSGTDVLALEVPDSPGALFKATKLLSDNEINVEYAYSAIPSEAGKAAVIVKADNIEKANEIIAKEADIKSLDNI